MLTVYFVQHAIALPENIEMSRPVSSTGIEETTRIAKYLLEHSIEIKHIYHSNKLRAQQTAELFAEVLQVKSCSALSGMNPGDQPQQLISQVIQDASMFVGHLPNIAKVVSKLISGTDEKQIVNFQNSAVACVEINDDNAILKWFITPEIC